MCKKLKGKQKHKNPKQEQKEEIKIALNFENKST